ncbi:ABC transporter permease subunit [Mycoplasmopsis cricetuli]|uniref:ABC transporter permease subunit n=1 Tax=Mycoplasmopsis cricetuli TaxID=171283 RepID=UPI000470C7E9|nr:ABC transporter permease subunit [Mycoplasmopsis cricetuli]
MKILKLILKRSLIGVVTLFLVLSFFFFILSLTISPSSNIIKQYLNFISGFFKFKFGFFYNKSYLNEFGSISNYYNQYFQKSLLVIVPSFFLLMIVGFFLGTVFAYVKNYFLDQIINICLYFFASVPIFVVAPLLIIYAETINIPTIFINSNIDNFLARMQSLILPILLIVILCLSFFTIQVKLKVQEVLKMNLIKFAKIKGGSNIYIYFKHVFKNSFILFLPYTVVTYVFVISYSLLVERLFQIPGQSIILISAFKEKELYLFLYFILTLIVNVIVIEIIIETLILLCNPFYKIEKNSNWFILKKFKRKIYAK